MSVPPDAGAQGVFTLDQAAALARQHFGLEGSVFALPSYADQNFRLVGADAAWVVKIAHADEPREHLEFENAVMRRVRATLDACPEVLRSVDGRDLVEIEDPAGRRRFMRVITLMPGAVMASERPYGLALVRDLGKTIGRSDVALEGFEHPAMDRELRWDLAQASFLASRTRVIEDREVRAAIEHFIAQFHACVEPRMPRLRRSVTHNDANDYNVLVADGAVSGLVDFGDAVRTCTVFNVAIAGAYAIFESDEPIEVLCELVSGYHAEFPLTEEDLAVLYPSVCMRMCVSAVLAREDIAARPENEYIAVSQVPVFAALKRLHAVDPGAVLERFRRACGFGTKAENEPDRDEILARRERSLGPSLSVSYRDALKIVRGEGQYLFDDHGRGYVDCVNNVCHVGHCHPSVVHAAQEQIAKLNTNTRYLHDNVVTYAERLAGLLPDPLSVCYFVCSGSEANELAVRLARAHTGRQDMVVVNVAYHGNTSTLVDLSPYKHAGPGGQGRPDHVHVADLPDAYRCGDRDGVGFAESVRDALQRAADGGAGAAAFLVESMAGCGGQVEYPAGYLDAAFAHARAVGALCIVDAVQVGFGRVGSHMWAFETQGVVPDIVTLGKPIGNGHPMAAVITTPEIAASFANGMEYFNTFGGNPVSCAIGLAVLDVIEDEALQAHAREVGDRLLAGFRELQGRFPIVGEVRGRGLILGIEMVRDRATKDPAAEELAEIVERMKDAGFLLSTDGRLHNVLKFKPPMPFSMANAELLLAVLERVLGEVAPGSGQAG